MAAVDRPPRRDPEPGGAGEALRGVTPGRRPRQRRPPGRVTLLPFTQLEFAGLIGLPEGRYLSREDEGERVLIVQVAGAPRPPRRGRRKPRQVDPKEPEPVPVTRVTVAGGMELPGPGEASSWLRSVAGDPERRADEVRAATRLLNRALGALRAGARDPLVQDAGATRALAVRIGYGTGEELADGRWTEARELPPPKRQRLGDVESQERIAAVLAGRDEVHPAETLLLRALLDAEQGRDVEASHCLRAASAALEERPGPRAEELRERIGKAERALRDRLER